MSRKGNAHLKSLSILRLKYENTLVLHLPLKKNEAKESGNQGHIRRGEVADWSPRSHLQTMNMQNHAD